VTPAGLFSSIASDQLCDLWASFFALLCESEFPKHQLGMPTLQDSMMITGHNEHQSSQKICEK
jgi:hypothetical protein